MQGGSSRVTREGMHFLLTNDDGIHAPGIAALERAVMLLPGATCTLVAPDVERSQCGHRVTTHEELFSEQVAENRYAVTGTPADCVRVALFALGLKPDFVLSGVNAGGNMGQDLYISGTCAGAREAAYHGLPAVAISHYLVSGLKVDWDRTARWVAEILRELIEERLGGGEYWNVNLPHLPPGELELPERARVGVCRAPLKVAYESVAGESGRSSHRYSARYAERPVDAGSDVEACFGGKVAVSRVGV